MVDWVVVSITMSNQHRLRQYMQPLTQHTDIADKVDMRKAYAKSKPRAGMW